MVLFKYEALLFGSLKFGKINIRNRKFAFTVLIIKSIPINNDKIPLFFATSKIFFVKYYLILCNFKKSN